MTPAPDLFSLESLLAFLALTALEIVLGIDNIVFIAILTGRLPAEKQAVARRAGITAAMLTRIALLLVIAWIMGLDQPWFALFGHAFSGRDVILLVGGAFLILKATHEIHGQMELSESQRRPTALTSFAGVVGQIMVMDLVFSLDSVITAVGMARHITVMIAAIMAAVLVMLIFAGVVSRFIERHPTVRVLALSFLLLIGVVLTAEGMGQHIDRGYIYFAMAFSLGVELLNLRVRGSTTAREPADSPEA